MWKNLGLWVSPLGVRPVDLAGADLLGSRGLGQEGAVLGPGRQLLPLTRSVEATTLGSQLCVGMG